jgi:hypothetical protein
MRIEAKLSGRPKCMPAVSRTASPARQHNVPGCNDQAPGTRGRRHVRDQCFRTPNGVQMPILPVQRLVREEKLGHLPIHIRADVEVNMRCAHVSACRGIGSRLHGRERVPPVAIGTQRSVSLEVRIGSTFRHGTAEYSCAHPAQAVVTSSRLSSSPSRSSGTGYYPARARSRSSRWHAGPRCCRSSSWGSARSGR